MVYPSLLKRYGSVSLSLVCMHVFSVGGGGAIRDTGNSGLSPIDSLCLVKYKMLLVSVVVLSKVQSHDRNQMTHPNQKEAV